MLPTKLSDSAYLAVRREFVLKVDGGRPLLYSLDYINTNLYFLLPIEGFALSLLDGRRQFAEIRRDFNRLFPSESTSALDDLLLGVDKRIRLNPSQTGIGRDGLLEQATEPMSNSQSFDPRDFIISPTEYFERAGDVKTVQRLATPINIYTIFTHRCVASCAYCYADRPPVEEMPLSRWREIIREMADLNIILASPDNGDTFARADGIDFLECLLEHEMHFLLSTKAYISRETIRRLIEAGFTKKVRGVLQRQVQLSIDAVDQKVAARVLQVKQPHVERRAETIENFLNVGIMPKVKAVITGLNYNQPEPIVDYFYPRGARVFHFVRYRRTFHRHVDTLFVEPAHIPTLRRQFERIRERYPDVTVVENLSSSGTPPPETPPQEEVLAQWRNRMGCGGGWSALGISADGNAFLCEQMKMDEPFYVGDARTQTIQEIWNGDRLNRFIYPERDQFVGTICEHCTDFESCMWKCGRCYRDSYFSYGTVFYPPPGCPHNDRPGLRMA